MHSRRTRVLFLSRVSRGTGGTAVVVGVSVVIGWWLRLPGWRNLHPALGTMNAVTAICLVLAGSSLLLQQRGTRGWRNAVARASAALLVLMGTLTVAQSWMGWTIPWDRMLPFDVIHALFPQRMPTATALAFLSLGTALLTLDSQICRVRPSELLALVALLISFLALIAYAYGSFSLSQMPPHRPLAFHTVLLLQALSIAVLAARVDHGLIGLATSDSVGGVTIRRLLPAALAIPAVVGWLVLEGQRAGWYPTMLASAYFALAIVVLFGALIWLTAESIHAIDLERTKAQDDARRLNVELEQRVVERTGQLEAANKELEAFSYSVAHDLRAPVRAVDGFSRMLLEAHDGQLSEQGRHHLRRVSEASQRMGRLIDDLLSLSRVSRAPIQRRRVDISAMADEIVVDLRQADPERLVGMHIQPGLHAEADADLLRIVLVNLLGNAWKFTGKTSEPAIGLDAISEGGQTVYRVHDNGAGFDMQYVDKLFGPFQRLHHVREFDGTGIGLATVQRIVHRHGGKVWAESAVGRGAAFYFTL